MEHIHDERYVFSSNRAIKMSTTVANTTGSDQSKRQSNDERNMFSSK